MRNPSPSTRTSSDARHRIRPSSSPSAWLSDGHTIKLDPSCARNPSLTNASATAQDFTFDNVLTGTPNKPIYTAVGRAHVHAAMEGFNAVIFAYGQTASGKTFTLTGGPTDPTTCIQEEPGIIPRSMRDIFGFIKRTPQREYLLRCSYLEIYNETVVDLLAPPSTSGTYFPCPPSVKTSLTYSPQAATSSRSKALTQTTSPSPPSAKKSSPPSSPSPTSSSAARRTGARRPPTGTSARRARTRCSAS